jgi:hypothetical protein
MKTDSTLPIRFFERRQDKTKLVVVTFTTALIITAMILKVNSESIAGGFYAIIFPMGLFWLLTESPGYEGGGIGMLFMFSFFSFLGWVLYAWLTMSVVRATKPRTALILYVLLVFLLVANIAGCTILAG